VFVPQRRVTAPLVVAGIFAAGAIGFFLARMLPSTPTPAAAQVGEAPVVAPVVASAMTETSVIAPESATPTLTTIDTTVPAPPVSASAPPRAAAGRPTSIPPPKPPPPKPDCAPPYRITADGVREYKPECLR
jgi:hypothetical protein